MASRKTKDKTVIRALGLGGLLGGSSEGVVDVKDGKIVAIGSFAKRSYDTAPELTYQLRGMATSPDVRGEGYGIALLEEARRIFKERQATGWWCNARLVAVPFYERFGMKIASEQFEIEGIGPHHVMVDRLTY